MKRCYILEKKVHIYIQKNFPKYFIRNFYFFKFESLDLSYLDMKYSSHNFLISNNLFTSLKNI